MTSIGSNGESPQLPILGQDILPPSATTSEDASSLVTSPGKIVQLVPGENGLGCSIVRDHSYHLVNVSKLTFCRPPQSGDASQPSSRASSPGAALIPPLDANRPDLSCLLQAASIVSGSEEPPKISGISLLIEAASAPQPVAPPVVALEKKTRFSLRSSTPATSRRTLAPRTRTRNSSRLAKSSTVPSPSSSMTLGESVNTHISVPPPAEETAMRLNPSTTSAAHELVAPAVSDHIDRTPPILVQSSRSVAQALLETPLAPLNPAEVVPSATRKTVQKTRRPRKSSNNAGPTPKDVAPATTASPIAPRLAELQVSPAMHKSSADSNDRLLSADTDGESGNQLSKPPTRIRIKGTKYLEQMSRDAMESEHSTHPTLCPGAPDLIRSSDHTVPSDLNAKTPARLHVPSFAPDNPPATSATRTRPTAKTVVRPDGGSKKDLVTPRVRAVKRPSSASSAIAESPQASVKRPVKPQVMSSKQDVINSVSTPVRSRKKKTPVTKTAVSVPPITDRVTTIPPTSEPPHSGAAFQNPIGHFAANTSGPLLEPKGIVRPRKKARRNNYPVSDKQADSPSLQSLQVNGPTNTLEGSFDIGGRSDYQSRELAKSPGSIAPQPINAKPSSSCISQTTSHATQPLPADSSDVIHPPVRASKSRPTKKRVVSAPLTPGTALKALQPTKSVPPARNSSATIHEGSTMNAQSKIHSAMAINRGGTDVFLIPSAPTYERLIPSSQSSGGALASTRVDSADARNDNSSAPVANPRQSPTPSLALSSATTHYRLIVPKRLSSLPGKHGAISAKSNASPKSRLAKPPQPLALPSIESPMLPAPSSDLQDSKSIRTRPPVHPPHSGDGSRSHLTQLESSHTTSQRSTNTQSNKSTKVKPRKRVTSATGPGSITDRDPGLLSGEAPTAGPSEESSVNRNRITSDPASVSLVSVTGNTGLLDSIMQSKKAAKTSSEIGAVTKATVSTESLVVKKKPRKSKTKTANSSTSYPFPSSTSSTMPVTLALATPSIGSFVAHPQNPAPFVPHPQCTPVPFVPHPQHQMPFVAHPQHAVHFVHPVGFVSHPQYPLTVLKAIPPQFAPPSISNPSGATMETEARGLDVRDGTSLPQITKLANGSAAPSV